MHCLWYASLSLSAQHAHHRERLQELREVMISPSVGMAAADFLPVVCDVTKEAEVCMLCREDMCACNRPRTTHQLFEI